MSENNFILYNLNNVGTDWYLSCNKNIEDLTYSPYLQLRCSNNVDPWVDKSPHYHSKSQEIFIVLDGELWMMLEDKPCTMVRKSLLLIQPGFPHIVIGGKSNISHFVLKIPHQEDKWIQTNRNADYDKIRIKMTENHFKGKIDR